MKTALVTYSNDDFKTIINKTIEYPDNYTQEQIDSLILIEINPDGSIVGHPGCRIVEYEPTVNSIEISAKDLSTMATEIRKKREKIMEEDQLQEAAEEFEKTIAGSVNGNPIPYNKIGIFMAYKAGYQKCREEHSWIKINTDSSNDERPMEEEYIVIQCLDGEARWREFFYYFGDFPKVAIAWCRLPPTAGIYL